MPSRPGRYIGLLASGGFKTGRTADILAVDSSKHEIWKMVKIDKQNIIAQPVGLDLPTIAAFRVSLPPRGFVLEPYGTLTYLPCLDGFAADISCKR